MDTLHSGIVEPITLLNQHMIAQPDTDLAQLVTDANPPTELGELKRESLDEPWPTLSGYLEEYYAQMGTQGDGLKTYFEPFDKALEGLRGIVIIGGEPGSGKTALAMQIAFDTASDPDGPPVLIYSFEMPKVQLVTRLFQRAGQIRYRAMQQNQDKLLDFDLKRFRKAQETIQQAAGRIIIRETKDFFSEKQTGGGIGADFDFGEQIRQVQLLTETYGKPPLIVIDSLHEVPVEVKSSELKQKIDYIMLNLRNMCDQTGATFIVISHQSRSGQKDGGLNSFLGSAGIEYTVDMACTIAIPITKDDNNKEVRDPENPERELIFYKNRYGTKPKALLRFDGQYMDFKFIRMLSVLSDTSSLSEQKETGSKSRINI